MYKHQSYAYIIATNNWIMELLYYPYMKRDLSRFVACQHREYVDGIISIYWIFCWPYYFLVCSWPLNNMGVNNRAPLFKKNLYVSGHRSNLCCSRVNCSFYPQLGICRGRGPTVVLWVCLTAGAGAPNPWVVRGSTTQLTGYIFPPLLWVFNGKLGEVVTWDSVAQCHITSWFWLFQNKLVILKIILVDTFVSTYI